MYCSYSSHPQVCVRTVDSTFSYHRLFGSKLEVLSLHSKKANSKITRKKWAIEWQNVYAEIKWVTHFDASSFELSVCQYGKWRVLDRKVRNIDLGARTETFKYPPHLAQEGRGEGLWGIWDGSNISGWIYLEHSLVQACFCRSLMEVDSNISKIKLDLL